MMIDRTARDTIERMIQRLFVGELTNYQLEDEWPGDSEDRFVAELPGLLWVYYDDYPETVLKPEQFGDDGVAFLGRVRLFLHSDQEYEWPTWPTENFADRLRRLVWRKGAPLSDRVDAFKEAGCFSVWPFFKRADYDAARAK